MNSQAQSVPQGGGAGTLSSSEMFQKVTPSDGTEKNASSRQGLFSPEAAICFGVCPALNRCVCFYGLGGPECAPQPLNVVGEPKIPVIILKL